MKKNIINFLLIVFLIGLSSFNKNKAPLGGTVYKCTTCCLVKIGDGNNTPWESGCKSSSGTPNYFEIAKTAQAKYHTTRKDYVIVVDYTKSIFLERLYVLEMKTGEIVIRSTVAHAWNSGVLYPNIFSNIDESNMSSAGCYVTAGTYIGKFGYSMKIRGLDKGVNDRAEARSIIFHSSKKMKTVWSFGCFATPEETNKKIIDLTKNGCLVCIIN